MIERELRTFNKTKSFSEKNVGEVRDTRVNKKQEVIGGCSGKKVNFESEKLLI